jgi:uncharacterized protein (DUF488 family)
MRRGLSYSVPMPRRIYTIGHSTRSLDDFVALLVGDHVQVLADVRHYPGSRRYPHFGAEPLAAGLNAAGIEYVHLPELGGRRRPRPDSVNTAWRNEAFRGYADYMETPEFAAGLSRLEDLAAAGPTAMMCAEAVWWRCHRGLIADALKIRGWEVLHIEGRGEPKEHPWTSAARVEAGKVSYAAEGEAGLFGGR